jgi:hypothetical protein
MTSFDLALETPGGEVIASIEVKTVEDPVDGAPDLTDAVRHATKKVVDRQGTRHPIEGSRETIIHITLKVGKTESRRQTREILEDGTVKYTRPDGKPISSMNLYDKIAEHLTTNVEDSKLLDRITMVDQNGRWIVLERDGKTWTRQR